MSRCSCRIAWEIICRLGIVGPYQLVPPSQLVSTFIMKLSEANPDGGTLFEHTETSLLLALTGFSAAVIIGVPLGLLMGWFRWLDDIVTPLRSPLIPGCSEALAAAGMTALDCPISGTGAQAIKKDLSIYGSGDRTAYERCVAVFQGFARSTYYLGEFGNGSRMKYVANLLEGGNPRASDEISEPLAAEDGEEGDFRLQELDHFRWRVHDSSIKQ